MTTEHPRQQVFEVRIEGAVPDEVLGDLADIQVVGRELRTSLRARIRDQSELHGFLAQLRTYGLEVVEVRRIVTPDDEPEAGEP
ncbi:hypothetical protein IDH50_13940 [Aeromicrobium tamlense]|uniref:Uncharacterized protein n=1 Tax=Aeromicrobium tamlense TaxID=375541 RepID=A0A8I0KHU5_9ACTN|nr:hypothetical protein [Aeromicrobium tamlense]MBD1270527.1 hypothetical protein [Aeromicrobium tamlense]MBD1271341.1 hypothetical protein [Aeromicrobium tamlense]NYI37914.1 hypothetical protein [Aeromicrobium tamlense]